MISLFLALGSDTQESVLRAIWSIDCIKQSFLHNISHESLSLIWAEIEFVYISQDLVLSWVGNRELASINLRCLEK